MRQLNLIQQKMLEYTQKIGMRSHGVQTIPYFIRMKKIEANAFMKNSFDYPFHYLCVCFDYENIYSKKFLDLIWIIMVHEVCHFKAHTHNEKFYKEFAMVWNNCSKLRKQFFSDFGLKDCSFDLSDVLAFQRLKIMNLRFEGVDVK